MSCNNNGNSGTNNGPFLGSNYGNEQKTNNKKINTTNSSLNTSPCFSSIPSTFARAFSKYAAFDLEWVNDHETDEYIITSAAFVDSSGNSKVLHIADFSNNEAALVSCIVNELMEYDLSMGWYSTGVAAEDVKDNCSDDYNDNLGSRNNRVNDQYNENEWNNDDYNYCDYYQLNEENGEEYF